jgi:putative iron-regulated protein
MNPFKSLAALLLALALHASARADVLAAFSRDLMLSTYATLAERCESLNAAATGAAKQPSVEAVLAARDAWKAAREPWETSEAFLFGPVDAEGHDPMLDSWPVNLTDLQLVLKDASASIEPEALQALGEGFTGFHVVEYLLFADQAGVPADLETVAGILASDARRARYLAASAQQLLRQSRALLADYDPTGGNFVRHVAEAGMHSELYSSKEAILDEVVLAMVGILEEIRTAKLLEPAGSGDASLLESRFSANTTRDVANNLIGVGRAFNMVVAPLLGDSAAEIQAAITKAAEAVERIPAAQFHLAPASVIGQVTEAANAVGRIQQLLEEHVTPRIAELSEQMN